MNVLKTLAIAAVAGAMSTLFVVGASAMPLAQAKDTIVNSDVQQVRDGCGRGMRYSNSRGRCVEQRDADPVNRIIREIVRPGRDCGRGSRWSERRGRCVRD